MNVTGCLSVRNLKNCSQVLRRRLKAQTDSCVFQIPQARDAGRQRRASCPRESPSTPRRARGCRRDTRTRRRPIARSEISSESTTGRADATGWGRARRPTGFVDLPARARRRAPSGASTSARARTIASGPSPRPRRRAARRSYEDALLSARRIPPKSPPRPGAEHDGERGPKKKPTRAPPPSQRASRAEHPMTLPSPPRATRRGSGARRARVPGPREPVEEVSDGEPLPPHRRARPRPNGHAADRRDPPAPSRRPSPHAAPRRTLPPADTRRSA